MRTAEWLEREVHELRHKVRILSEFAQEVRLPPYSDSDLRSLLDTLRARAGQVLDEVGK